MLIFICVICGFYLCNLCSEEEITILLEDETASSPQQVQKEEQSKEAKKEIKKLYKSGVKFQKKKKLLSAIVRYKKVLSRDPYYEKARERLSRIYTETKIKLDEKILYRSEDVYYAQSVLYFINNDLTAALNEWGKCLAITPLNDEVRKFFDQTKEQLAEKYERENQQKKEERVRKYLEEGIELFNSAKYTEATERFQWVLRLSPGHVSAQFYLDQINDILAAAKDRKHSKKTGKKKTIIEEDAISINYEKAEDFYNEGLREYAAGHIREAIGLWKKCLKYNPSHEKAQANIEKAKSSLNKE